ncbi:MAG: glycosyltransferase [Cyanobacteria bacterium P01_E01_bin.45]
MLIIIQVLLVVAIAAAIAFYCVCITSTLTFKPYCSPSTQSDPPSTSEQTDVSIPVSILIPVQGVDPGALRNWQSFCQQHYGEYEILFGVMDADDPAIQILQQLREEYPDRVRVLSDLKPRGINFQISNLTYLYDAAYYDRIVLADSDIRVGPEYLATVMAPLRDDRVGLVTCPYVEKQPRFVGAAIHALNRCTEFIPSLLIARWLDGGLKCALGPTIATRKSVMATFGGLNYVLNRIGSDFHIGKMTARSGFDIELSGYVLDNEGDEQLGQVFRRELRWARTIRINRGGEYYGMGVTFGTVYALLLLLISGLSNWAIAVFALTWAVRILQALVALVRLDRLGLLRWLWLLPLRDAMSFVIWVGGTFGHRVYWRGRWLAIGKAGLLEEYHS